jgi:splicing factor 45
VVGVLTFVCCFCQNMVGPGEVDDELEQEVKDECSTKYGPVERCVVLELRGRGVIAEEAVRIFVEFRHQSHADQGMSCGARASNR